MDCCRYSLLGELLASVLPEMIWTALCLMTTVLAQKSELRITESAWWIEVLQLIA